MSKDFEKTIREAEEAIANLENMAEERMSDAETKIKKGIVQTAIWVVATAVIYFIWGTTWFFWVAFVLTFLMVGGMIFAKVMIAKAHKTMARSERSSYDFDADILDDDDDDEDEFTMEIETNLFGTLTYSSEAGLDIDEVNMRLNGKEVTFSGIIFEDLTKAQIENAIPLLDNLEKLDAKAREKWLELFEEEDEEVCGFVDIHYNDFGDECREIVFKKLKIEKQDKRLFLENLEFGSFHITEGDKEDSVEIVMDYSLIWENGTSFSDQILAMHFSDNLEYVMHTHDS